LLRLEEVIVRNGFFVTGTDTGVGKTVVSTVLTMSLRAKYWKPIQTGSIDGTDSEFVKKWAGANSVLPEAHIFKAPLSPHLASSRENKTIDLKHIVKTFETLSGKFIVEGAGGALVPINESALMCDLIKQLNLPAVIAVDLRLGCINHSLLTIEALRSRGITVAGFISVGNRNADSSTSIEQYGRIKCVGHIPRCHFFSQDFFNQEHLCQL
jgi:dethiobiotin synthase